MYSAASSYITFNIFLSLEATLFRFREALGKYTKMIDSRLDFLFQESRVFGLSRACTDNCLWTLCPPALPISYRESSCLTAQAWRKERLSNVPLQDRFWLV